MDVAAKPETGKVHFFRPEHECDMAAGRLSKAHLLLIIMGIAVNNFFEVSEDGIFDGLGKAYNDAWRA